MTLSKSLVTQKYYFLLILKLNIIKLMTEVIQKLSREKLIRITFQCFRVTHSF